MECLWWLGGHGMHEAPLLLILLVCCPCCVVYHITLQVRWLNRMLDLCHWYLLSTRVMLTQHSAALYALQGVSSSSSKAGAAEGQVEHYHEPGHKSTVLNQPYTPPHQQLSDVRPLSLVQRHAPLLPLINNIVEDCR